MSSTELSRTFPDVRKTFELDEQSEIGRLTVQAVDHVLPILQQNGYVTLFPGNTHPHMTGEVVITSPSSKSYLVRLSYTNILMEIIQLGIERLRFDQGPTDLYITARQGMIPQSETDWSLLKPPTEEEKRNFLNDVLGGEADSEKTAKEFDRQQMYEPRAVWIKRNSSSSSPS